MKHGTQLTTLFAPSNLHRARRRWLRATGLPRPESRVGGSPVAPDGGQKLNGGAHCRASCSPSPPRQHWIGPSVTITSSHPGDVAGITDKYSRHDCGAVRTGSLSCQTRMGLATRDDSNRRDLTDLPLAMRYNLLIQKSFFWILSVYISRNALISIDRSGRSDLRSHPTRASRPDLRRYAQFGTFELAELKCKYQHNPAVHRPRKRFGQNLLHGFACLSGCSWVTTGPKG